MTIADRPEASGIARLSIANDHEALDELGAWIADIAARDALSKRDAFHLDLVLSEAVTNIMDYGSRPRGAGRIELACRVDTDDILVEVIDDGPPFDPTARPAAVLPEKIEDATPGGLGIHLMRSYARAMAYHRENERNVLSMTLPRGTGSPSP